MVSWIYAFKRGFTIFLWSIVWGIVGGVVALVISGGSILALITNPTTYYSPTSYLGMMVGIIVGTFIGGLIASIGNYATIVKIVLESIPETERAARPPEPPA